MKLLSLLRRLRGRASPHPSVPTESPPECWSTLQIGDAASATIRCIAAIPGGVALGSDYGLTLYRNGIFEPFPWPEGSRREARRVEAMVLHDSKLYIGTSQSLFVWDFTNPVRWTRHGRDEEDGWDDICCLHSAQGQLYQAFRTRFYGGEGPPDVLSMATDPSGRTFVGTREGELKILGEFSSLRHFLDRRPDGRSKGRPIRHLAWAEEALWVAAQGQLHRWDGQHWRSAPPEPTFLHTDPYGRLWGLGEGQLLRLESGWLRPMKLRLERPWSLCGTQKQLWIGGMERLWRLPLRSLP